eukprot:gene13103-22523_t
MSYDVAGDDYVPTLAPVSLEWQGGRDCARQFFFERNKARISMKVEEEARRCVVHDAERAELIIKDHAGPGGGAAGMRRHIAALTHACATLEQRCLHERKAIADDAFHGGPRPCM